METYTLILWYTLKKVFLKGKILMNRTVRIIVSIVLCVWIFAMGIELGAYRERKAINTSITVNNPATPQVQPQTTVPTTLPTTTAPQTTAPTTNSNDTTSSNDQTSANADNNITNEPQSDAADSTQAPTEDQSGSKKPESKEEIAAAFNDAMNKTKNMTQNCNAKQDTNVQISVLDCSVPRLTGTVNSIVSGFTGPESNDYAFVNGVTSDGTTLMSVLPPSNKETSITADGISVANSEDYGDGGYKLTLTLVPETGSLDAIPPYHSSSVGYLDLGSLDIPMVTITKADMTYTGATVTVCVNKDGLLDSYDCKFPMTGSGEAKALGATGTASFEGSMDETWTFTWQ